MVESTKAAGLTVVTGVGVVTVVIGVTCAELTLPKQFEYGIWPV